VGLLLNVQVFNLYLEVRNLEERCHLKHLHLLALSLLLLVFNMLHTLLHTPLGMIQSLERNALFTTLGMSLFNNKSLLHLLKDTILTISSALRARLWKALLLLVLRFHPCLLLLNLKIVRRKLKLLEGLDFETWFGRCIILPQRLPEELLEILTAKSLLKLFLLLEPLLNSLNSLNRW